MRSRKSITEEEILDFLQKGELEFPPLKVVEVQTRQAIVVEGKRTELDALLTMRWGARTYRFGVETKGSWTPKVISQATSEARRSAAAVGVNPLILIPYLGEERIATLEAEGVSGIDLCGNGIVVVPDELLVLRTGRPNQFRWKTAIRNVYRKNSSIVARTFLLVPQFGSLKEALEEIRRRGGEVTLATVSKVCKGLEEDLVIERGRGEKPVERRLRLLQPAKLLDLLAENYEAPGVSRTFRGKYAGTPEEFRERLAQWQMKSGQKVIRTGAGSVEAYAVMAREPVQSFYCSDLTGLLRELGDGIRETDRFANVALEETRDEFAYFDGRPGLLASPIQTYLELMNGDKREKETAEQVRRVILGSPALASAGER